MTATRRFASSLCDGTHSLAAMRCGIELSADEILGEPDDQVVIDTHLHPLAKRPLTLACAPAVRDIAAASVQPLRRAIFAGQAGADFQRPATCCGRPRSVTCSRP